jgi:hypothetical protein
MSKQRKPPLCDQLPWNHIRHRCCCVFDFDGDNDEPLAECNYHEQLRADNERLRKDAERYRWLRDEHDRIDPMGRCCWKVGNDRNGSEWCELVDGIDLDQMIDAAIAGDSHE